MAPLAQAFPSVSTHQPFDSLAVRWQQRSRSAAGLPSASMKRTMSSPSSLKGFGPFARSVSGMTACQNLRKTGCWVTSIAELLWVRVGYELQRAISDHGMQDIRAERFYSAQQAMQIARPD